MSKINNAQMTMIDNAGSGIIPLPRNGYELSGLLRAVVIAENEDAIKSRKEKNLLKVKIRLLSVAIQIADKNKNAYISMIKFRLSSRKYYKQLTSNPKTSTSLFNTVIKEFIEIGAIVVVNSVMIQATDKAESTIEDLKKQLKDNF